MGAPEDDGEVEELDASMLEPEDALVLAVVPPVVPTVVPPTAPKPIAKADATMAITAEDGWFDVPVPSPLATPTPPEPAPARLPPLSPPPAIPRTLTPRPPPARASSPRAASHDTTTKLVDDDVAIVASIALPRTPTPRAVSHDTTTKLVDDDVAIVASIALPRTVTPRALSHDTTTKLVDDDVAIVESIALPQPSTPAPVMPAPMRTPDERLQREASALATELPMRAALLHAYRAFAMLDDASCAAAAQHAPDARFVAFTRRWLAAARGDREAIAAAVRAELSLAGDATERAALLWQIAHADEATLRQIVELDGQDVGAWLALAALAMRRQAYPAAAEAFEAIGARTTDGMARAVFLASAAGLREARCADDAGARAIYDRAFEADPGSVGIGSALEMFALRTGARSSADHVRMVALEAQRVGDLEPQLGYHERAGDLYWEALRDGVNAAPCYERAAALAPTDVVALGKLASLYEQDGQYGPLATVYEALLERLTEPVRLGAVLLRLGGLYESRLDRTMDALRCYQAALAAVPTLAPAAQALARLHQSRQRWGEAAIVLMGEVDRLQDATIRAARYLAIAEMLETHLGTIPQVVKLFERALALDPGQTAALDGLDRVYRASGRWPELIALHETQLEGREGRDGHAAHPMRVRALRIALAALYHERAAAPEQAAAQLRLALVGAPDPLFVMVALARALADAGRWAEHVAVLEQQAQLVGEGPELVATLYRIAAVIEVRLDDPVRAQGVYQRVLALAPRHELAAQALRRLHVGQARWEDALASERRLLALAERPEEAAVILHRIAHVAEEHLARPDDAITAYEQALAQLPTYRPARVALERLLRGAGKFERLATLLAEQAAGGIELTDRARLLAGAALILELHVPNKRAEASARYGEALVADPTLPAALWGLLRGHVRAGDWKRAAEALETLVARATSGKVRARLTIQRVHVLERLGDVERAAALAEHAFLADADPAIILARLRLAMARGDVDTLLWLDEAARVVTDPRLASGLLRVRAHAIEAGGDREAAAEAFAIALQHGNLPAVVDGLARHRTGPALGEALAIRAALIKDPPTRALLYAVAGTMLEQPDARAHAYSAALAAQPGLFPALEGLRLLALRAKDYRGAATICAEMAAVAVDVRNRVELFEEAAAICVEHLRDDVAAIAHYREVLAVEPGRPQALARVLALLEGAGDWGAAAQLIAAQLAAVEPAARARLLARRAYLLADHLGDGAGAIADLERALALQPDADELRWRLAGLHESLAQWADAAQAYEALATSAAAAPDARCRALVAQARIWTTEVPDYPRAQRYLEDAARLAGSRDRGIAGRLAEVAVLAGDLARATALYQELATYGDPVARVEALLATAALRSDAPDAPDPIAAAFELVWDDPQIVPMLERHYARAGQLDRFLVHAEAAIARARAGGRWDATTPLRVVLGKLYARAPSAPASATPFLEAAVLAAPDDVRLRVTLASTYARVDDAAAIRELRIAIEHAPTDPLPYQRLVEACARTGRELGAALLATVVSLLEGDDRPSIVLPEPVPGALPPDDALGLFVGATRAPDVRRLAAHLDPHLHALFDEKAKLDGVVPLPESYPIVPVIRAIAAALGVPAIGLSWRERADLTLVATEAATLVLSPRQVKDDPARLRFGLGYVLARLAGGSAIAHVAPLEQVQAMFVAITDPEGDKRVSAALPRRARKELEKLAPELAGVDAPHVALWDAEERRRGLACGVIASCDLRTVAAAVCPDALAGTLADRRGRLGSSPMLVEALRFATTDACWTALARFYGR